MQGFESNEGAWEQAGRFNTTHWSVVLQAGGGQSSQRTEALEVLCRAYWHPIYAFARRKGWGEEDAKDLTQQFFSRLLERNDFSGLDRGKGKFRTFLLTAFTHFLANEYDRVNALKRGGGRIIIPLDELSAEESALAGRTDELAPGTFFDRRWAKSILEKAMEKLKREMSQAGKKGQFELLKIFLTADAAEADYPALARKLEIAPASVPVFVHRLRQRYRQLVRSEVAQTVATPTELDEEMRHLFEVLNH